MLSEDHTVLSKGETPDTNVRDVPNTKKISRVSVACSDDSGFGLVDMDDLESVGAGEDSVDCPKSRESLILQSYFYKLKIAMEPELDDLASKLFSAGLIEDMTKCNVIDSNHLASRKKCDCILKDIERNVAINLQFLSRFIDFLSEEGSNALKSLAVEMRESLANERIPPPLHSLSENNALVNLPKRLACLKTSASSPAAFHPVLSSPCGQCEFQQRAFLTTFEKFCDTYLMTIQDPDGNADTDSTPNGLEFSDTFRASVETQTSTLTQKTLTPLDGSVSEPKQLSADLFQAQTSLCRQDSVSSVSDFELAEIGSEFLEKLRQFQTRQKRRKRKIMEEKQLISERLSLTEQFHEDLSSQVKHSDQQLTAAQEKISVLEHSLETSRTRNWQLNKEIIQYKRQLQNEECANGSSLDCKHFARCAELEKEKEQLKKQIIRQEKDCVEYKARNANLGDQITQLLAQEY